MYFSSYFFILSILSLNALSTYSSVTVLLLASFAQVHASPTTCAISVNLVDSFPFSPASLDAYYTTLAIADLFNGNSSSCSQNV